MIGDNISIAIGKLFKSKKARPFELPVVARERTLRQLLEKLDLGNAKTPGITQSFSFGKDGGRTFTSKTPVDISSLVNCQTPAPAKEVSDPNENFYSIFYDWLKQNKLIEGLNIDHSLSAKKPWPIVKRYDAELKKRTGFCLEELIPYSEDVISGLDEDDFGIFNSVYMPLYCMETDSDYVVLIETLSKSWGAGHCPSFPEAAVAARIDTDDSQEKADSACLKAAMVFEIICQEKRWKLLPAKWSAAMEFLVGNNPALGFWDYEECRIEIEEPGDIDWIFKAGRQVMLMRKAINPLIEDCQTDSGKFWRDIVDHLLRTQKKPPDIFSGKNEKKNQPLIEVLV